MYTVFDAVAAVYLPPFFFMTDGEAIRAFANTCNDGQSQMAKNPSDFTLFYIGEFDDETGLADPAVVPVRLKTGVEALKKEVK